MKTKFATVLVISCLTILLCSAAASAAENTEATNGTSKMDYDSNFNRIISNDYGTNNGNNAGNYRTYAATDIDNDTDFDWGWLGLLGLIGLAGARNRNRERERT
ncbi:WGxxGxxG family protein [Paenibacillus silvisoli]|uniref:WGxxGxxG family protein n=1 Tax=Paenibacillus silvisoli TaxID=3110539 RepID=UPI0028048BD0|nr:WGxxGxxG family protein [Paenibacillus silvisoli]